MILEKKYEVFNRLLGLNRDLFFKLAANENKEDNFKNLFGLCEEIS
jgi:hypothetical protein